MSTPDPWPAPNVAPTLDPALDPAFATDATVQVRDLSVWFGPKVALSELAARSDPA